ncbi:J domain-containing protein [Dyella tabacisoli]|uniref:J domain-containing protein n=1 Tax=Dyella tabacisoli TaxID=2282381 RepID=A0A369UIK3_9GAMM|nr:J domain-containing protein [Dyella tabacisoli]RDD80376.1 J domain-containing protein [Dyella tabacisoli]
MARRIYIPAQVIDDISRHIQSAVRRATEGFWSANEDEDTLTGHLGACLKTGTHTVNVVQDEVSGPWKWSFDYSKFRGRGASATESHLGADGIFELNMDWGYRAEKKSLLFQSKTEWSDSPELVEQSMLLSTWREAAIAIDYKPGGFEAFSIDSVLASRGIRSDAGDGIPLQDALGDYFIKCKVGSTDLSYDARSRRLYWRDTNGLRVGVQFSVPHRMRLKVQAPVRGQFVDKEILPAEIHQHRMEVAPEEMLMPVLSSATKKPKEMKRALAKTYHPDRYDAYEQLFRDLANRRMQEINAAADELKKRGDF